MSTLRTFLIMLTILDDSLILLTEASQVVRTLPNSVAHDTLTWLGFVGEMRQRDVILTGRLGRLGSTPGLLVGIGIYK